MIIKIISGGQTGADLAGLDAAIANGISHGGWCPKGRINESGKIDKKYNGLREIDGDFKDENENYARRTKLNIRDSGGTLIFTPKIPLPSHIKDGTVLTIQEVKKQNKPFLLIDLSKPGHQNEESIINWINEHSIQTLNIAGPRESTHPGIYQLSLYLLNKVIPQLTVSIRPRL